MLMVGLQDERGLGGDQKNRKQRRAAKLNRQGANVQILSVLDSCKLASIEASPVSALAENPERPAPCRVEWSNLPSHCPRELDRAHRRFSDEDGENVQITIDANTSMRSLVIVSRMAAYCAAGSSIGNAQASVSRFRSLALQEAALEIRSTSEWPANSLEKRCST
ncbi:MAG: hypothetical protein F4041_03995 [Acidobacteriia bacterium]|nr:hypothetical protein [Terriglobia bacterium]